MASAPTNGSQPVDDDVVLTGFLVKSPPANAKLSKWHQRFFVLRKLQKLLEYFEDSTRQKFKGSIDLNRCWKIRGNVPHKKYPHMFSLLTPDREYCLVAGSEEQKAVWIHALTDVCMQPCPPRLSDSSFGATRGRRSASSQSLDSTFSQFHPPDALNALDRNLSGAHTLANVQPTKPRAGSSTSTQTSLSSVTETQQTAPDNTPVSDATAGHGSVGSRQLFMAQSRGEPVWLELDGMTLRELDFYKMTVNEEWPLAYLRTYSQNGRAFEFEAGRRCPGGEGTFCYMMDPGVNMFNIVDQVVQLSCNANPSESLRRSRQKASVEVSPYQPLEVFEKIAEEELKEHQPETDSSASAPASSQTNAASHPQPGGSVQYTSIDVLKTQALSRALQGQGRFSSGRPVRATRHDRHVVLSTSDSSPDDWSRSRTPPWEPKLRSKSQPPRPADFVIGGDHVLISEAVRKYSDSRHPSSTSTSTQPSRHGSAQSRTNLLNPTTAVPPADTSTRPSRSFSEDEQPPASDALVGEEEFGFQPSRRRHVYMNIEMGPEPVVQGPSSTNYDDEIHV